MANESNIKPGDWVRFQQNGEIITGVVQYVRPRDTYPTWKVDVITDRGSVEHDRVLEVRKPAGSPSEDTSDGGRP